MIIDVMSAIKERCKYPMGAATQLDGYIDSVLEDSPERCYFVTTDSIFEQYRHKNKIVNDYYITAVFDLSQIFMPYVAVKVSLFVLSKKETKIVKTGIYIGKLNTLKKIPDNVDEDFRIEPIDRIPEEYNEYCELINQWLNKGCVTPCDSDFYEFNAVERKQFNLDKPTAKRHTKQVFEVINSLKSEPTVQLSEIAEIIVPRHKQLDKGYSLHPECLKYPFNLGALREGTYTDTLLKKGDIVVYGPNDSLYLINVELENVYASRNMRIVRPFNEILPEYLFVYLNSDTSKIIRSSLSAGTVIHRVSSKDMASFPVIIPPKDASEYKKLFETIYLSPDEKSVNELTELIVNLTNNNSTLEGTLLKEQAKRIKLIKDPKVRKIITDDIDEMKICFENGAYKATLILAGSILEAFLIDLLGTVHGKDYYNQDYYVPDRRDPSRMKRAELIDFIDAIAEIKKPDWMEEATKAHQIRNKRNMVHAKLCMRGTQQINESTCKMVIDYLIEIISTRYKNFPYNC